MVSKNLSRLASSYPKSIGDTNASSGGIHVRNGGSATIDGTAINGNMDTIDAPEGKPVGFDAGICVCGPRTSLVLRNSTVANNPLSVTVGTSGEGGSGKSLDALGDATIAGTRVTGNSVVVKSPSPSSVSSTEAGSPRRSATARSAATPSGRPARPARRGFKGSASRTMVAPC